MTVGIFHVDDVKRSRMPFTIDDCTNTTQISTSSDHAQVSRLEFNEVKDFCGGDLQLNGVVHFDHGIGVTDCATVVGHQEWDALGSSLDFLDFTQFVLEHKK